MGKRWRQGGSATVIREDLRRREVDYPYEERSRLRYGGFYLPSCEDRNVTPMVLILAKLQVVMQHIPLRAIWHATGY